MAVKKETYLTGMCSMGKQRESELSRARQRSLSWLNAEKGSAMETKAFKPRSKDYWAGRATERRNAMDHPMTIGPASDVRRIDPETGEVIEDIESEENARLLTGPRWPRSR